jgi:mRNA-degrading endonuclease RelE of RelBE toxin-antitoxin system
LKEWKIFEREEYKQMLSRAPVHIQQKIINMIPIIEEYPLSHELRSWRLEDELKDLYEYKIDNYRLIFRLNINSKKIEFLWLKAKPFATTKRWVE